MRGKTIAIYLRTLKVHAPDHIIALRAHHSKKRDEGLPPLNPDELKPHSAQHTLQFIEDEYVEKDDDASITLHMGGHSNRHKDAQNKCIRMGGLFHFAHLKIR